MTGDYPHPVTPMHWLTSAAGRPTVLNDREEAARFHPPPPTSPSMAAQHAQHRLLRVLTQTAPLSDQLSRAWGTRTDNHPHSYTFDVIFFSLQRGCHPELYLRGYHTPVFWPSPSLAGGIQRSQSENFYIT